MCNGVKAGHLAYRARSRSATPDLIYADPLAPCPESRRIGRGPLNLNL